MGFKKVWGIFSTTRAPNGLKQVVDGSGEWTRFILQESWVAESGNSSGSLPFFRNFAWQRKCQAILSSNYTVSEHLVITTEKSLRNWGEHILDLGKVFRFELATKPKIWLFWLVSGSRPPKTRQNWHFGCPIPNSNPNVVSCSKMYSDQFFKLFSVVMTRCSETV